VSIPFLNKQLVLGVNNISKVFKRKSGLELLGCILGFNVNLLSNTKNVNALFDITFNITKGEAFGIIGRNGSGKSTLLQIIAGTLSQTSGSCFINGRVSALLELGSGFNPDFTGIENIYLSGSIYGISRVEMDLRIEDIKAFADIGEFIDRPVKTYSSGMLMRVAFAVAISVEPDILIIDEALSVGDILFQQKCNRRLKELMAKGVSLLVVTHDTSFVLNICQKALWLDKGRNMYLGLASECVKRYLAEMATIAGNSNSDIKLIDSVQTVILPDFKPIDFSLSTKTGENTLEVSRVWIYNDKHKPTSVFKLTEWITIIIEIKAHAYLSNISAGCELRDRHGQVIFATGLRVIKNLIANIDNGSTRAVEIRFQVNLCPGNYTLDVGCGAGISEAIGQRVLSAAVIEVIVDDSDEIVHGLVKLPSFVKVL